MDLERLMKDAMIALFLAGCFMGGAVVCVALLVWWWVA